MVLIRAPNPSSGAEPAVVQPCRHHLWTQWRNQEQGDVLLDLPRPPLNDDGRCHLKKLRWSSRNGCSGCRLVVDALEEWSPDWKNAGDDVSLEVQIYSHLYFTGDRIAVTIRVWEGDSHSLLWLHRRPKEEPFYPDSPGRVSWTRPLQSLTCSFDVVADTSSPAGAARVWQWLCRCEAECEGCRPDDRNWTPRRLISIGSFDNEEADVRLVRPTCPTTYACLSYYGWWGDPIDAKSTVADAAAHVAGMSMSYLPRAVRDAVVLCRRLRIPALWVDSICTVAGERRGFRNLAVLDETFKNAHLTIFAKSPTEAMLGPQAFAAPTRQLALAVDIPEDLGDPDDSLIMRAEPADDYDGGASVDIRGPRPVYYIGSASNAKRQLVFKGDEMVWSCHGRIICECGHIEDSPSKFSRREPARDIGDESQSSSDTISPDEQQAKAVARPRLTLKTELGRRDSALSEEGTSSPLTVGSESDADENEDGADSTSSDMDPILLAEEQGAGPWTDMFVTKLAWTITGRATRREAQHGHGLPTWSRTSIDGPVKHRYRDEVSTWSTYDLGMKIHTKVDEVVRSPAPAGGSPTKGLTSSHVVLTGPLAEVEVLVLREDSALGCRSAWQRSDDSPPFASRPSGSVVLVRDRHGNACPVALDFSNELRVVPQTRQAGDCGGAVAAGDPRSPLGFRLAVAPEPFYCLHLFTWENRDLKIRRGQLCAPRLQPWFLLLRRSAADASAYERAGLGFWDRGERLEHPYWVRPWLDDGAECQLLRGCVETTVKIV